jgi:hypothetical protein
LSTSGVKFFLSVPCCAKVSSRAKILIPVNIEAFLTHDHSLEIGNFAMTWIVADIFPVSWVLIITYPMMMG